MLCPSRSGVYFEAITIHAVFENTKIMKRRTFLNGTLAEDAPTRLPAFRFSLGHGVSNCANGSCPGNGETRRDVHRAERLTQSNRAGAIATITGNRAWHPRLPNEADYPRPVIMPLFSPDQFVTQGLLEAGQAWMLREIRKHGALPFCIAPKRSLRAGNAGVPSGVFETRRFFLD